MMSVIHSITVAWNLLEYYIQASALDFHRALEADIFIGNVRSTFSGLVMESRNFERTYTYSRFNEVTCTRPVFRHDHTCADCFMPNYAAFYRKCHQ